MAEIHRDKKRKTTAYNWLDFMPHWKEQRKKRRKKQSPKDMRAIFEKMVRK